ncbi:Uncharacterised protein [Chlamydia trachomatis]|nr:Uncharacterised protein [Chlamydia trachomatis]
MVTHHPGRGRAGLLRRCDAFGNGLVHLVADPVLLREFEVEYLSELFGAGVQMLPVRVHPGLRNRETRRIVLVEQLPPFTVDLMHLIAVIGRMRAIGGNGLEYVNIPLVKVIPVQVLGQTVCDIDAETVHTTVTPEP